MYDGVAGKIVALGQTCPVWVTPAGERVGPCAPRHPRPGELAYPVPPISGLGATTDPKAATQRYALISCPQCTFFEDGTCHVCTEDDNRVECEGCEGGVPEQPVWWKRSELVVPIAIGVVSSVLSAVATSYVMRRLD